MSVCFKSHDTVELIGADSCIRGRGECVALSIRYGFYMQPCLFMDVCDFAWPHISSLCALTCTLISPQFAPFAWLFCLREREWRGKQRLSTFRSTRCFVRLNFPRDEHALRLRLSFPSRSFKFNIFSPYPSASCFISDLLIITSRHQFNFFTPLDCRMRKLSLLFYKFISSTPQCAYTYAWKAS